jgi:adenine deaminase
VGGHAAVDHGVERVRVAVEIVRVGHRELRVDSGVLSPSLGGALNGGLRLGSGRADDRKPEFVSLLHRDGVTVLLGTDTQQPFVAPGIALHREFDAIERAGIPRRDSFRLATATAATVLGLKKVGTIAAGGRAELIVSRTDPRQSRWSVQRDLVATIARGVLVTAADLDKAIRAELARFENKFSEFATRLLAQLNMRHVARNFVG